MITEVAEGSSKGGVDTSVAGFVRNLERYEIVDFSQGIFKTVETFIIKTPKKTDSISFSSRKLLFVRNLEPIRNKHFCTFQNLLKRHGLQLLYCPSF